MKIGIVKEFQNRHQPYIEACKELGVDYEIIDIISNDWISIVKNSNCVGFLVRPSCSKDVWKRMYDERLYFINNVMKKPIYPSFKEIFIYENKRTMAYWLQINDIPMPKTWIFYNKGEATDFVNSYNNYPIVFKTNIGSAAIGVHFINDKNEAKKLVNKIFTRWNFLNLGYTKWQKTKYIIKLPLMDDKQYNNVLFQEKIDVKYEWRGVKIGESYFAHKKLGDSKGFHSGSGQANYDNPPLEIMDFVKYVCDIGNFSSMNVDFFEDKTGKFYVNELQTIFGSKIKPYQMCVDGNPGRYLYTNKGWVFEEGMFNQNNSYNLRVADFLNQLRENY